VFVHSQRQVQYAPEGAEFGPSGGEGVPAAPPPAPSIPAPAPAAAAPAPRVPFVLPPEEGGPAPQSAPGQASSAPGGQPAVQQDNPIPYSRVREMLAQREAQIRREFESRQPQGPTSEQRLAAVRYALRAAGFELPDEAPPQPVTLEQFDQRFAQYQQQVEQKLAVQAIMTRGQAELDAAKAQYAEHFQAFPDLENDVLTLWGQHRDKSIPQIVKERVEALDRYTAARSAAYQRQKVQDRLVAPVRPVASPPGSGRPPQHDLSTEEGMNAALDEVLGSES
jgi:hypothetical protein